MSDRSSVPSRILGACATRIGAGDSLQNINTTTLDDGALCYVTDAALRFELNRESTASPNGTTIIAPSAGPGRWLVVGGGSGAQGAQGATGAQGSQGATGAQGVAGSGSQGAQGSQGSQGATGTQGAQGSQGSQGAAASTSGLQLAEPTTAALAAVDITGLADGIAAQVAGFDSFVLDRSPPAGSFAAADGVNIIQALGGGGPVWVRQYNLPATNEIFSTIFVNGSTGSDSARNPQNSGTPLKTLQEAFTRIARLGIVQNSITIEYTGTGQSFDADLTGAIVAGSPISITVVGPITVLATQAITTFQVPVPASNTRGSVTFPAPGYAPNEPLRFTGNTGNAIAFVTLHPSANVDNVTNFYALDGTVDNPANGNNVEHVSMPSTIGNVSVRLPADMQVVIQNCVVTGKQVSSGDNECLVFDQCQIPNGDIGYGPLAMVGCLVGGVDAQQNAGTPTVSRESRVYQNCYWTAGIRLNNSANTVFIGSNTAVTPTTMTIVDSIVTCQASGALADFSFWGLGSTGSVISVKGSLLDLGFTTVWGSNTGGVNQTFELLGGGRVLVESSARPVATGPTNAWKVGANRVGTFAQLPVSSDKIPASFTFSTPSSGVSDQSFELTAQTGNIGATNFFGTAPVKGLYQISAYVSPTVAGTSGALNVNAIWTDKTGVSQTKVICTYANIAALVHGEGGVIVIEADGATAVQYSVTGVGTAGALSYNLRLTCELKSSG